MTDPVRVPVGECRCPGTPHAGGDWVDLAPRLTLVAGAAAMEAVRSAEASASEVEAALTAAFLRHNITAWSFTGEPGADGRREPLPVTRDTIAERLDWASAHAVAERCNELYAEDLFRPLATRLAASSSGGPTGASTSATTASGERRPRRSSPSSPADSAAGSTSGGPGR